MSDASSNRTGTVGRRSMTLHIDNATRSRLTAPAVRGFLRIAEQWGLSEAQQLSILGGSVDALTLAAWRQTPPASLGPCQLERMSGGGWSRSE